MTNTTATTVHFRKSEDGHGWLFEVAGDTYRASRNEAGFAGRAWELERLVVDPEGHAALDRFHFVADQLASRTECVEHAQTDADRQRKLADAISAMRADGTIVLRTK